LLDEGGKPEEKGVADQLGTEEAKRELNDTLEKSQAILKGEVSLHH